jgi:hypothetical protein
MFSMLPAETLKTWEWPRDEARADVLDLIIIFPAYLIHLIHTGRHTQLYTQLTIRPGPNIREFF